MIELFLAGTLSGVGCSSPVGFANTGIGPGTQKKHDITSTKNATTTLGDPNQVITIYRKTINYLSTTPT